MDEVLEKSVTKNDHVAKRDGLVTNMIMPFPYGDAGLLPARLPVHPPPYWTRASDYLLRYTIHQEGLWSSAVGIACAKFAALGWDLTGTKLDRFKNMLHRSDEDRGWVSFTYKIVKDWLTTDNGPHFEVIKEQNKIKSRVLGIEPLDSLRCTRTSDPDWPVIYTDRLGVEHWMRRDQVISFADMPGTDDNWNGVGTCAARRAYRQIVKLAGMEMFLIEKVTGQRPLAVYLINGVMPETLESLKETAKSDMKARGNTQYMGVIMAGLLGENAASMVTIPFAELPDGFDRKEEFDIAALIYADALGIDIQDIQPLSGQGLGTGTQSITLDNKEKGKGLAMLRQDMTHALNRWVLPPRTVFAFSEKDYRDLKAAAEVEQLHTDNFIALKEAGVLSADQVLQLKVDLNELPRSFLPAPDSTPVESVTDADSRGEATAGGDDTDETIVSPPASTAMAA